MADHELEMAIDFKRDDDEDVLDKCLFLESDFQAKGYEQGIPIGIERAFQQGFALGRIKGLEIGREIGFFNAFCQYHISLLEKSEIGKKSKNLVMLKNLLKDTEGFDHENSEDFDVEGQLKTMKARFKILNASLGTGTRKLNDLSF